MTLRKWKTVAVGAIGLTLFASIPAFAGGSQQPVWGGGHGRIGRTSVGTPQNPLATNGQPGTPMGNGGTGPQNPGSTGTPVSGGPFTPGQNGAPTGPFGPGTIPGQKPSTGPFNSSSSNGSSSGGFFSKISQAMSSFFSIMMTVNMFRWMFGWAKGFFPSSTPGAAQAAMVSSMPANSVMPVAATVGSTGIGANTSRNASTQPGAPGTPIVQRAAVDAPVHLTHPMAGSAAGVGVQGFNHHVDGSWLAR